MSWFSSPSLVQLRKQVDLLAPQRNKDWDGTIGDQAHAARKSEHNPDSDGEVRALDITNDPNHGMVSDALARAIVASRDFRVQYVISNGKIYNPDVNNWAPRNYTGANKHDHHCHVSVKKAHSKDARPWNLDAYGAMRMDVPITTPAPTKLQKGSRGEEVKRLQRLLGMRDEEQDGVFGEKTRGEVRKFQKAHGLLDDGIVGPATWAALKKDE